MVRSVDFCGVFSSVFALIQHVVIGLVAIEFPKQPAIIYGKIFSAFAINNLASNQLKCCTA
jgi:hypothetical protein